jgi:hypothetical protein
MKINTSCKTCIHKNVCEARRSFFLMSEFWNDKNPFVELPIEHEELAQFCSKYKIKGDVIVDKTNQKLWSWVPGK